MYHARMNIKNTQFVFALLTAAKGVESRLNRALSCVKGISFTEYQLLEQLKDINGGSATRIELARAINLTPSAVTRALKPLEKIGLVSTEKGARDARQSIASLTQAGEELLRDADQLVLDEIAQLDLPRTVRTELTQILAGLSPKSR